MSAPVFTAGMPVLSLLLLLPLTGGVLAMLLPPRWAKNTAALFSLLTLLLASGAYYDYNPYTPGYAMEEHYPWIPPVGAAYHLGVDGLSMPLVLLTALLTFLAVVFSWDTDYRPREFFSMLLLMDVGVMGVFVSLDLLLFFLFWEAQLVPMYFLIALWGGPRKRYAALKFFLYTQAGSLLILLGIAAMYLQATNPALPGALPQPTFDMPALARALQGTPARTLLDFQPLIFTLMFIGFAVKLPVWPLHTWLPDAHVEAPTAGSVLLAGVLLKMGGYGIFRIGIQMLPAGATYGTVVTLMFAVAAASILFGALLCLVQRDLKSMIAYSSVSHMGFVVLGAASIGALSTGAAIAASGAILQMFSHGLIAAMLFMLAGAVHHHTHTRDIPRLGGLASRMPIFASLMVAASLASAGLPGMSGFVAEFLVFLGSYSQFGLLIFLPILGVVLTAAYFLWALQRTLFGPPRQDLQVHGDLAPHEWLPLAALLLLVVLIGILPMLVLLPINQYTEALLQGLPGR